MRKVFSFRKLNSLVSLNRHISTLDSAHCLSKKFNTHSLKFVDKSLLNLRNMNNLSMHEIRRLLLTGDVDDNGTIDLELDNETGIAKVCMNNPIRKNGFNGRMMNQFSEVLDRLEQWKEGRALILYGADGFFCSGADLTSVKKMANIEGAHFISTVMHDNCRRLEELPFVSIAMIQGMALGGGSELSAVCDFRVFTPTSKIGFVQSRMGVSPGWGGGVRLIRLVGPEEALKILLSAKPFGLEEAKRLKIVSHVIPSDLSTEDALRQTTDWFMQNYGNLPAKNSQKLKKLITASKRLSQEEALKVEAELFCQLWGNEYHKECLARNIKHNE